MRHPVRVGREVGFRRGAVERWEGEVGPGNKREYVKRRQHEESGRERGTEARRTEEMSKDEKRGKKRSWKEEHGEEREKGSGRRVQRNGEHRRGRNTK